MDAIIQTLDQKLKSWTPRTSKAVRERLKELIEQADADVLDIGRSRSAEQEVLDVLDGR